MTWLLMTGGVLSLLGGLIGLAVWRRSGDRAMGLQAAGSLIFGSSFIARAFGLVDWVHVVLILCAAGIMWYGVYLRWKQSRNAGGENG